MTKQEAIAVLENLQAQMDYSEYDALNIAIEALETTPHGKWIKKNVSPHSPYRCSVCGGAGCSWYNFCQNCGADMREEKE